MQIFKRKISKRLIWESIIVGSFLIIFLCYYGYKKMLRESNEKTAVAKVYNVTTASKGFIIINYYFITENMDTIRDSERVFPERTMEKYMNDIYLVKYYAIDPLNNTLILNE